MTISKEIEKEIKKSQHQVFSCYDFLSSADYKTVSKTLKRLADRSKIVRLVNGLYASRKWNSVLGIEEPISREEIVAALARKYQWNVVPSGAMAMNQFGFSQQVPFQAIYASTGPYKKVRIANYQIVFKHSYAKDLVECSTITSSFAQALRALGRGNVTDELLQNAFEQMEPDSQALIRKESTYLPAWMRKLLQNMNKGKNNS